MRFGNRFPYALVFTLTTSAVGLQRVAAQEALKTALESDAAAQLRGRPVVRPAADVLRIGPVTFDVTLGYSLEASDNIRYSRSNRQSDVIQRPSVNVGITY